MTKRSVLTTFAVLFLTHMLVSCGDSGSSSEDEMIWKLGDLKEISYRIDVSGQELVDLYSLAPSLAEEEDISNNISNAENSQSEEAFLKSPKIKMNINGDSYVVLKRYNAKKYGLEHVSGKLNYTSELDDLIKDSVTKEKSQQLFNAANGLTLANYNMNLEGEIRPSVSGHFRYLNYALMLPSDQIFLNNKSTLPFNLLDTKGDESCITIPSTEKFVRQIDSTVSLDKLKQNDRGDIIAEMTYKVSEKVSNSAYENRNADSFFLDAFTRSNEKFRLRFGVRFDESQRASKDERKIIFHCKYAGKHTFNITRGWMLRVDGLFTISAYRKIEPEAERELGRYKFNIVPIPNEDVARKTKSEYLREVDGIVEMEEKDDTTISLGSLIPSLSNKGSVESGQKNTSLTAAQTSNEQKEDSIPLKVTVQENTVKQDIVTQESEPFDNWRQLQENSLYEKPKIDSEIKNCNACPAKPEDRRELVQERWYRVKCERTCEKTE